MANTAPNTVAIVDDDESARRSLGRMLRAFGFESHTFASADAFLAADRGNFSCLLLDLQLEGMSGVGLARELGRRGSRIPIIVITAHSEPELRAQLLQLGCAAFFHKTDPGTMIIAALQRVTGTTPAVSTSA